MDLGSMAKPLGFPKLNFTMSAEENLLAFMNGPPHQNLFRFLAVPLAKILRLRRAVQDLRYLRTMNGRKFL